MKHLKIGDQAPGFTSTDQNEAKVSLGQYIGKKVVIYFYPKDNTPGCTTQACNIRDHYELIQSKGIVIIGVSADSADKHKSFIKKYDLPFILLADTEKKLLNLYGVWGEKKFMGKIYDGIHRTTFILDEQHKIISIIDKPKTKDHSREILQAYESSQQERK